MTLRRGEILRNVAVALLVFLPILANATLPADERAPVLNLLVYAGGALLAFGLGVLLPRGRWLLLPLAFVGLIYASFVWGSGCDVSYHAISAIWETNTQEAGEFLQTEMAIRSYVLLAVLLLLGLGVRWIRLRSSWTSAPVRVSRRGLFAGGIVAILCLTGFRALGGEFGDVYPFRFVSRNLDYLREVHAVRGKYERLEYEYEGPAVSGEPLTLVLVIGESARSASWSLYGYDRETNPELRRLLEERPETTFLFDPALPAGRVTRVSVPSMLSVEPAENYGSFHDSPSVLRIFRAAGAATFVASAQLPTGYYEGLPNLVLGDAETERRVAEEDALLTPVLAEFLREPRPVRLVVLQLQGSHLKYDRRYPAAFDRFSGRGNLVDTYDNSILYTDHLLAGWIRELHGLEEPAMLLYVSDHGENLDDAGDGNLSHGARALTPFEVQVPMALAVNDAFAERRPGMTARIARAAEGLGHHDYVAHTLLGAAGLRDTRHYRPRLDLSSPEFDPPAPWFAENLREARPYTDVPEVGRLFTAGEGR